MDTQVILQVVVVDKLGVAVKADVGALTCVFSHVDLQFVLSEKRRTSHDFKQCVVGGRINVKIELCFTLRACIVKSCLHCQH